MRKGRCRIGFMVSGQGRLALEAIRHHESLEFEPSFVILDVTAAEEPEKIARQQGIFCHRLTAGPRLVVQGQIREILGNRCVDHIFLTFDRILHEAVLELFPNRFINLHLSLLPAFQGMRPLERALEKGAPFIGATMHLVTPKVDDGPPLAQCVQAVAIDETRESIGLKLFPLIRIMYLNVVRWASLGRIPQDPTCPAIIKGTQPGMGFITPEPEWWPET